MSFRPAWAGQVCSLGYQIGPMIEDDLGITLTREQAGRVIDYWRVDPISGTRATRRAALRRPKGAGKSPEAGYCGYAELVLPVMFVGWKAGQPVAAEHADPWVQFAAVSEDQTDNVMVWLYDVLADRPLACRRHGIDLGRTRVYLKGRPGRIEPVTAAAGSREGQRITFGALDQTESWSKENGGLRLADTLRRNAAKMGGWTLELQNAPALGDGSVADRTARASERAARGVLYDTREPAGVDGLDLGDTPALQTALAFAYGESAQVNGGWVDTHERLVDEIQDPDTDPSDAKRYYLNVAAPSSDWAFDRERLLFDGDVAAAGAMIVAGFDGARHDDSTALVAVDVETGSAWLAGLWERPERVEDWDAPEAEVTAAVEELFDRWSVWRLYADPPYWNDTIAAWEARFKGPDRKQAVVPWWTNRWRPVGFACRSLATAIRAGAVHLVPDEPDHLAVHVRNAVRRPVTARDEEGRPLWTITKPAPGRKIDAAMALVLAWECRNDAVAAGVLRRKSRVMGF